MIEGAPWSSQTRLRPPDVSAASCGMNRRRSGCDRDRLRPAGSRQVDIPHVGALHEHDLWTAMPVENQRARRLAARDSRLVRDRRVPGDGRRRAPSAGFRREGSVDELRVRGVHIDHPGNALAVEADVRAGEDVPKARAWTMCPVYFLEVERDPCRRRPPRSDDACSAVSKRRVVGSEDPDSLPRCSDDLADARVDEPGPTLIGFPNPPADALADASWTEPPALQAATAAAAVSTRRKDAEREILTISGTFCRPRF